MHVKNEDAVGIIMNKTTRLTCGIFIGFFVAISLSIVLADNAPFIISEYMPVLCGGFVSFLIIKEKPILVGCSVATLLMASSIGSFLLVIRATHPLPLERTFGGGVVAAWLFYVPVGIIGASLANIISRWSGTSIKS